MDPEIVNMYIDRLLIEVAEGAKSRILLETQLRYTESLNANLSTRIQQLESQIEKQNKKTRNKEVDTSSDTF
jgi:hypothetical protein